MLMKNIVGGVFYKPQKQKEEQRDIFGNIIDLEDLRSYQHTPVRVTPEEPITPYQQQYHFGSKQQVSQEKPNEEKVITPTTLIIPAVASEISKSSGNHFIESGVSVGKMQELLDEAAKHGIYFRVTSGYRPGATTSSGKTSWHSSGEALDITPLEGTSWEDFRSTLKNNPEFLTWMRDKGFGILDETTSEMLAKTGGTGAHFHIGRDQSALEGLKQFLV